MKTLQYKNIADLCIDISTASENSMDGVVISVIAKYMDAREIIQKLIIMGFNIGTIDIEDDFTNNEPFLIDIMDNTISCERITYDVEGNKKEYIDVYSDIIYMFDDCKNDLVKHLIADDICYLVYIGEENRDDTEKAETFKDSIAKPEIKQLELGLSFIDSITDLLDMLFD